MFTFIGFESLTFAVAGHTPFYAVSRGGKVKRKKKKDARYIRVLSNADLLLSVAVSVSVSHSHTVYLYLLPSCAALLLGILGQGGIKISVSITLLARATRWGMGVDLGIATLLLLLHEWP